MRNRIVSFTDLETSGLSEFDNELIQLAAIKVEHLPGKKLRILDAMEIKVFPTQEVPKEAAKINGYDAAVWKEEAVTLAEALDKYLPWVERTQFGGQNPQFDKRFLDAACRKVGREWPRMQGYTLIDVAMLAWPLLLEGKIPNTRQETLMRYLDLGEQSHEALDDIGNAVEIYRCLLGYELVD